MITKNPITHRQRATFMDKLAHAVRLKNGLVLGDWEDRFMVSYLRSRRDDYWFTPGRCQAVDRMWTKYGSEKEINYPHPADRVTERPQIQDADPSGCQFIIQPDGGAQQERCNAPAVCREPGGLRYCESHGDQVRRAVKGIALVRF